MILFAESVRSSQESEFNYYFAKNDQRPLEELDDLKMVMWRCQRNLYLTGFSLFVGYALNRFLAVYSKYYDLKDEHNRL